MINLLTLKTKAEIRTLTCQATATFRRCRIAWHPPTAGKTTVGVDSVLPGSRARGRRAGAPPSTLQGSRVNRQGRGRGARMERGTRRERVALKSGEEAWTGKEGGPHSPSQQRGSSGSKQKSRGSRTRRMEARS